MSAFDGAAWHRVIKVVLLRLPCDMNSEVEMNCAGCWRAKALRLPRMPASPWQAAQAAASSRPRGASENHCRQAQK